MQIHELKPKTPRIKSQQVGRGGKRGKTSGRGTKGQKARAGRKLRPELRDIIKKLPKKRGYRFKSTEEKPAVVNLLALDKNFEAGALVTPALLVEKGVVARRAGRVPKVKVLADGGLTKALVISSCQVSAQARAKIEQIGGSIK